MRKEIQILVVLLICAVPLAFIMLQGIDRYESKDQTSTNTEFPLQVSASGTISLTRGNSQFYPIILNTSLITAPEKIMVYRTLPPTASDEDILAFAEKMDVHGSINEGNSAISIATDEIPNTGVEISKASGCLFYINENVNTDNPKNLPSDEDAVKIATAFLKEKGLLPDSMAPGYATRHQVSILYPNGTETKRDAYVEVYFKHDDMSNIPVEGAGIEITLGENGLVSEFYSRVRHYQPYKELAIKTPEEAFTELTERGVYQDVKTPMTPDRVSIDNVYLAFHGRACAYEEEYLQPVYIFTGISEGKYSGGEAVIEPVKEYIPALTDDAVNSISF